MGTVLGIIAVFVIVVAAALAIDSFAAWVAIEQLAGININFDQAVGAGLLLLVSQGGGSASASSSK